MELTTQVSVNAPLSRVWSVVTNIEEAADIIAAVESVEVVERPSSGMTGLKWRETRISSGRRATEVMTITEAREPEYYVARAESHGATYVTRLELRQNDSATSVRMTFNAEPHSLAARLMWGLMGWLFRGGIQRALSADLRDIKAGAEARPLGSASPPVVPASERG